MAEATATSCARLRPNLVHASLLSRSMPVKDSGTGIRLEKMMTIDLEQFLEAAAFKLGEFVEILFGEQFGLLFPSRGQGEIAFLQGGSDPQAEGGFEEADRRFRRFLAALAPLVFNQLDGFLQRSQWFSSISNSALSRRNRSS